MIGFIGIGVMGRGMVHNLLKDGFEVAVYTRSKAKADTVVAAGAIWCDSVEELVQKAQTIITIVGYPVDVIDIYKKMKPYAAGKDFIDMTTSTPTLAKQLAEEYESIGATLLDAPVSGGDVGAKNGTLAIMVGGDEEAFKRAKPIFECLGKNIARLGSAGAGQHTKCANQIAVAGSVLAMAESLAYAKKVGLDEEQVQQVISKGAAGSWSLDNYAPRIFQGNFEPGFYIDHYVKDLGIVLEEAKLYDVDLPGTKLVASIYKRLQELGYGSKGTQAIWFDYQK